MADGTLIKWIMEISAAPDRTYHLCAWMAESADKPRYLMFLEFDRIAETMSVATNRLDKFCDLKQSRGTQWLVWPQTISRSLLPDSSRLHSVYYLGTQLAPSDDTDNADPRCSW